MENLVNHRKSNRVMEVLNYMKNHGEILSDLSDELYKKYQKSMEN
ncbi:hypothetical protein P261_00346 [Lachnospiraceae bacterium TWA4]|nr:hypothetical protein P261_00346 [Lachnospiraceae bacterium TWA4]